METSQQNKLYPPRPQATEKIIQKKTGGTKSPWFFFPWQRAKFITTHMGFLRETKQPSF